MSRVALWRQLRKKSGPCILFKAMGLMLSVRDEERPRTQPENTGEKLSREGVTDT